MKMILLDDHQHAQLVELDPEFEFNIADYMVPCPTCGLATLWRDTVDCTCLWCQDMKEMETRLQDFGWSIEHPGYWYKTFAQTCVVAGWGEYRIDIWLGTKSHALGYNPDLMIELDEWPVKKTDLVARKVFNVAEFNELQRVYDYLYVKRGKTRDYTLNHWGTDWGEITSPDSVVLTNHYRPATYAIELSAMAVFGTEPGAELTAEQHSQMRELGSMLMEYLGKTIK